MEAQRSVLGSGADAALLERVKVDFETQRVTEAPHRHLGQHVIDRMRGGVGHVLPAARGTETAALAREGDGAMEAAAVAAHADEAVRQDPAAQEGAELPSDGAGQPTGRWASCSAHRYESLPASCRGRRDMIGREMLARRRDGVVRLRLVRDAVHTKRRSAHLALSAPALRRAHEFSSATRHACCCTRRS